MTEALITVRFNKASGTECDVVLEGVTTLEQQIAWTVWTTTGPKAPVAVTVGEDQPRVLGPVRAKQRYLAPSQ